MRRRPVRPRQIIPIALSMLLLIWHLRSHRLALLLSRVLIMWVVLFLGSVPVLIWYMPTLGLSRHAVSGVHLLLVLLGVIIPTRCAACRMLICLLPHRSIHSGGWPCVLTHRIGRILWYLRTTVGLDVCLAALIIAVLGPVFCLSVCGSRVWWPRRRSSVLSTGRIGHGWC